MATSVWSAADAAANGMTLSNGGLTASIPMGTAAWRMLRTSIGKTSGKIYMEVSTNVALEAGTNFHIGTASSGVDIGNYLGASNYSYGKSLAYGNVFASSGYANGSGGVGGTVPVNAGDTFGIAVDFGSGGDGSIWISRENVWITGDPSTGAGPIAVFTPSLIGAIFFGMSFNTASLGASVKAPALWTIYPTAASQKYAPPSGFSAWDTTPAQAYLARTVGGNEGGNAAAITALIDGLVADGVWAKLDALYVLAQQNATDAKLNLIGTSYGLTNITSQLFTPYQGYTGNGNFIDTGFNATTAPSPHLTQNNGSAGAWMYSNPVDGQLAIGTGFTVGDVQITPNYGGSFYGFIFVATGGNNVIQAAVNSLYVADRSASNRTDLYVSGAVVYNDNPNPSQAPNNANMHILGGSVATVSAAFFGASLGAAGQLALYNRLQTYMNSVPPAVVAPAQARAMVMA